MSQPEAELGDRPIAPGLPTLGVAIRAALRSQRENDRDMAASIAFFSFFSLFPLLIVLAALVPAFVDIPDVERRLIAFMSGAFPGSAEFIRTEVEAVVRLRGAAGAVSLLALLWSGRKVFGALMRGVNEALGFERDSPALLSPVRQFGLALLVPILVFVLLGVSSVFNLLTRVSFQLGPDAAEGVLGPIAGHLTSFGIAFLALVALYRLIPYRSAPWEAVVEAAAFAGVLFEIAKTLYNLYLDNVAHLEAVYGSLSSIAALLLWLYVSSRIVLLGARVMAEKAGGGMSVPVLPPAQVAAEDATPG